MHVRFRLFGAAKNLATKRWGVFHNGDNIIGRVKWRDAHHRYIFLVEAGGILDTECLREIAAFLEQQTRDHLRRNIWQKPSEKLFSGLSQRRAERA